MKKWMGILTISSMMLLMVGCQTAGQKATEAAGTEATEQSVEQTTEQVTAQATELSPESASKADTDAEETESETESVTGSEQGGSVEDASAYIDTSDRYHFQWSDGVGGDYDMTFVVPQIESDADGATAINQAISDFLTPSIEETQKCQEQELSATAYGSEYSAWVYEQHLFIKLHLTQEADVNLYAVYCMNLETGDEASQSDIKTLAGFSDASYMTAAKAAVQSTFESLYSDAEKNDAYSEQLSQSVSDENIADATCYIDENGKPALLCKVYSLAGASYYWQLIPMA